MAKMKHGRGPERKKAAWPFPTPRQRGGPGQGPEQELDRELERALEQELKPTRAFKAELARAYGVEEVPRRARKSLEKTLLELPDQLPARPRPVLRAFRTVATVAAVLAVTFALLWGVNGTYPQITEALPGLGQVFMAMNGDREREELPTESQAPTPAPTFNPVEATCQDGSMGILTVSDAWCDGETLSMELDLLLSEELRDMMAATDGISQYRLLPGVDWASVDEFGQVYSGQGKAITVEVTVGDETVVGEGEIGGFTGDGDGHARALWTYDLEPMEARPGDGDQLEVRLYIEDFLLVSSADGFTYDRMALECWEPAYTAGFALQADTAGNRHIESGAKDGDVVLTSVDYAPSRVEVAMTVPFMGYCGDIPFADNWTFDGNGEEWTPLGSFPELACQDGSVAYGCNGFWDAEGVVGGTFDQDNMELTFVFTSTGSTRQATQNPLVLTLYETPEFSVYGSESMRRVTAEFTIDLATGRAYASENYVQQGRERSVTAWDATLTRLDKAMAGQKFLACGQYTEYASGGGGIMNESGLYAGFDLLCPMKSEYGSLMVNAYSGDKVVRQFAAFLSDSGEPVEDSAGSLHTGVYIQPSGKEEYRTLHFQIYYDWEAGYVDTFTRLELTDVSTGEVLIEDIGAAWFQNAQLLLGQAVPRPESPAPESPAYEAFPQYGGQEEQGAGSEHD